MSENTTLHQNIIINDRNNIVITGIQSVDSFDDNSVVATTINDSVICIDGTNIVILDVNLEKGQFEASGKIDALYYEEKHQEKIGTLKSIFKKR